MIDIFYYYFYLAYTKVTFLYSTTPKSTAAWSLGLCLSFFVVTPFNLIWQLIFDDLPSIWIMIGISILFFLYTFHLYIIKKRSIMVIKQKPQIFGSKKISILITIAFFIISILFYAMGFIIAKKIKAG